MTNKEIWQSWSDDKKNKWIAENILGYEYIDDAPMGCPNTGCIYDKYWRHPSGKYEVTCGYHLNGNGFFEIAEKLQEYYWEFAHYSASKEYGVRVEGMPFYFTSKQPTDVIALAWMEFNNIKLEQEDE